ncbi:MAG: RNA polymerase sigma factor [Pseudomonadota bacterium]|nr:RNA polymerase sigma factor [Pseudomonadota bacterium]
MSVVEGADECSPEAEERALLARVCAGDRTAFESLYRCYRPRLLRFLARTLWSPAAAEEVLNDTMLVVWRRADTFNGSCKLSTWIFAIAYRTALKARRILDDPSDEVVQDEADESTAGPEGVVIAAQQAAAVRRMLEGLPAEQRAVVELTYFQDFSYREIAAVLCCPVDTVKTRMFHARRKLRLLLDAQKKEIA